MVKSLATAVLAAFVALPSVSAAVFDNNGHANFVAYWGQNSYGAGHGDDPANWQKNLSSYCDDDSIDVFPVSFLLTYFGKANLPVIELANTCNSKDNTKFGDSDLLDCSFMADEIKTCQAKGKLVTISMGGATGANTFGSDEQAKGFADQVWDIFLGGSSETRPFGDAVLDGVDLDIESGGSPAYAAFVTQLRTHFDNASKPYYVTAAPQCIYPDANLGATLDAAYFDAVYVQFYNNPCGLNKADDPVNWNFGNWDYWARNVSPNKNVKIYLGAPAAPSAAGSGYLEAAALIKVATDMRAKYPSFGGVMVWDASQARANDRFDKALKDAMVANGATGFKYPACDAPEYASGTNYNGGDTVSYKGSIWRAKWSAADEPKASDLGSWVPISACGTGEEAPAPAPPTAPAPPSTPAPPTEPPAQPPAQPPATPPGPVEPVPPPSTPPTAPQPPATPPGPVEPIPPPAEDPCPPEEPPATPPPPPPPSTPEEPCPPEEPTTPPPPPAEDPCPEEPATPAPPPATPNTSGGCAGAKAWDAASVFVGGDLATYNGKTYKAGWWTQNEQPGGSAGVWTEATCSAKRSVAEDAVHARREPRGRYSPHSARMAKRTMVASLPTRPNPPARYNPHGARR